MEAQTLAEELERLRAAVALGNPVIEPMHEINAVRQEGPGPTRRWFRSVDRELMAGESDGRWCWLEYTFPSGKDTLVLRWHDGQPARLWQVDTGARRNPLNPGSEILQALAIPFPANELQQMEQAMQNLPHSLWARVVKLALELHRSPA